MGRTMGMEQLVPFLAVAAGGAFGGRKTSLSHTELVSDQSIHFGCG